MLERDKNPTSEGSGTMLFQLLKSLLMILPQSTCYNILKDRLVSVSRFRQSTSVSTVVRPEMTMTPWRESQPFVKRIREVRALHCTAKWQNIRADSLEVPKLERETVLDEGADRRGWLGYSSKDEEIQGRLKARQDSRLKLTIEEVKEGYHDLGVVGESVEKVKPLTPNHEEGGKEEKDAERWKNYWEDSET